MEAVLKAQHLILQELKTREECTGWNWQMAWRIIYNTAALHLLEPIHELYS